MNPEEAIIHQLVRKHLTLATAESCTGGLISHRLTNVSGSSAVFVGGIVAYSNEVKKSLLGVLESSLVAYGAVSNPVALEMAQGICNRLNSDMGVGVTGIAGPTGGTAEKPVGLVYISVVSLPYNIHIVKECRFHGSRSEIKQQTSDTALNLLLEVINSINGREDTHE
ncbi:MAG TPA: CinA family protein [Candidatus Hydrogenedens sp.]|jgi:PncC family amidohydrolase|nr:CinA family protein [Candidatus Hydrogenedens sp.]